MEGLLARHILHDELYPEWVDDMGIVFGMLAAFSTIIVFQQQQSTR